MMSAVRRGPSDDRGVVMERILSTARASFAEHGYAATSMRAVAVEARVDPKLVAYYFGDKTGLLEACLQPPPGYLERVDLVVHGPIDDRGEAMVRNMLTYWEAADAGPVLRAMTLTAVHDAMALDRLTTMFRRSMVAAVADGLDDGQRFVRAGLAASAIIGLCMTRFVYRLEPIASMRADDVARLVGATVQQYLVGELPEPARGHAR